MGADTVSGNSGDREQSTKTGVVTEFIGRTSLLLWCKNFLFLVVHLCPIVPSCCRILGQLASLLRCQQKWRLSWDDYDR